MIRMNSFVISPRSARGSRNVSNSSRMYPGTTPSAQRPRDNWSSVAIRLRRGERLAIGHDKTADDQVRLRRSRCEVRQQGERVQPVITDNARHVLRNEDVIGDEGLLIAQLLRPYEHVAPALGIEVPISARRDVLPDTDSERRHVAVPSQHSKRIEDETAVTPLDSDRAPAAAGRAGRTSAGTRSVRAPAGPCALSEMRDVAGAVEQAVDGDPALGAGQRRAGAGVDAVPEGDVLTGVDAVDVELVRASRRPVDPGCTRRAASMSDAPAGMSTPPSWVRTRVIRNCVRSGLSSRSVSSMKLGIRSRSSRTRFCRSGRSPSIRKANVSSRTVVSWPPANRLAASSAASFTSGVEPSGNVAVANPLRMSLRGSRRRSSMYSLNCSYRNSSGLCADVLVHGRQPLAEQLVVGLGHALEVGDDGQRERLRVLADHLERARRRRSVDQLIGEAPHEVLVLLEALRRDEPHQQVPVRGVVRRVEGRAAGR